MELRPRQNKRLVSFESDFHFLSSLVRSSSTRAAQSNAPRRNRRFSTRFLHVHVQLRNVNSHATTRIDVSITRSLFPLKPSPLCLLISRRAERKAPSQRRRKFPGFRVQAYDTERCGITPARSKWLPTFHTEIALFLPTSALSIIQHILAQGLNVHPILLLSMASAGHVLFTGQPAVRSRNFFKRSI